jgi:hypothetical protein
MLIMSTLYAVKEGMSMGDEAREALLLAVFNDLPDTDKDAVLALMEKIGQKETVLTRDSTVSVADGNTGNLPHMG